MSSVFSKWLSDFAGTDLKKRKRAARLMYQGCEMVVVMPLGPKADEVRTSICDAMRDPDDFVSIMAMFIASRYGWCEVRSQRQALVDLLNHQDAAIRELAARTLGAVGTLTVSMVDALVARLEDKREKVVRATIDALIANRDETVDRELRAFADRNRNGVARTVRQALST